MKRRVAWGLGLATLLAARGAAAQGADAGSKPSQVVYHFDDTAVQTLRGLRNLRNHLDADPTAKLTVVAHAAGVDGFMEGAKAADGTEYAPLVSALAARGVRFEICEITLRNRQLKREQFIQEVDFTPSGVVRLAKLQGQGYAYIKP